MTPKAKDIKENIDKADPIEIYNLLCRRKRQAEKKYLQARLSDEGLVYRIYKNPKNSAVKKFLRNRIYNSKAILEALKDVNAMGKS